MSAYKELELAETERDEYEARQAIKWECREDAVEEREESCSMTYEEAIDKIVWTPLMRSPNENGELKEALYMACNALENAELFEQIKWERDVALAQLKELGLSLGEKTSDKYRWHDLRKNPEDLPKEEIRVEMIVLAVNEKRNVFGMRLHDNIWAINGFVTSLDVIAWREIEPFASDTNVGNNEEEG